MTIAHLFQALIRDPGGRSHPAAAGILYAFCPAAARWRLAGADPVLPFDPLWAALENRAAGKTLREVLLGWGLDGLLPYARSYVHKVEAYRAQAQNRRIRSPEQLPTFLEDMLPVQARHQHDHALRRIGGWRNFYPFLRAWAFVLPDWFESLALSSEEEIHQADVLLCFPGLPDFPVPFWRFGKTRFSLIESRAWAPGSFVTHWIALLASLGPAETLHLLNGDGLARNVQSVWQRERIFRTLEGLTRLARQGPYPPLTGLNDPGACRCCGYMAICLSPDQDSGSPMTSLALDF